ncbi:hypothetical protein AMC87_PD00715 (plasmid) [Rhizobium phaseoli]|nr:hypothetical protein AMC87_PD00715 [Rhizobium phaseoli]
MIKGGSSTIFLVKGSAAATEGRAAGSQPPCPPQRFCVHSERPFDRNISPVRVWNISRSGPRQVSTDFGVSQ